MKLLLILVLGLTLTAGAVPNLLNYQGKLLAPGTSDPVANGPHSLEFNLYDSAIDGELLWGPFTINANTSGGFFNVILGPEDSAASPRQLGGAFSSADNVFLSIALDGGEALEPRQQILTSPFAFQSNVAETAARAGETPLLTGTWNVPAGQSASIQVAGNEIFAITQAAENNNIGATLVNGHIALRSNFGIFSYDDSNPRQIEAGMDTTGTGGIDFYVGGNSVLEITSNSLRPRVASNAGNQGGNTPGMFLGVSARPWKNAFARDFIVISDERQKDAIENLDYGLEEVMALRPVRYQWKESPEDGPRVGFLAQEVQEVLPEAVNVGLDPDETLGVKVADLLPVLIKGMQEQQVQIEALQAEILELKAKK